MSSVSRLRWRKEAGRFAAYPLGTHHPEFVATVSPNIGRHQSWVWHVSWPRWFEGTGYADDRQAAADAATDRWWRSVATEVPRDIEGEVLLIAARVMVRPPPNSLYAEDSAFLTSLMNAVRLQYEDELKQDALPRPVKDLMSNLSQELFRRRTKAG
jgi:hypothetical protein